LRKTRALRPEVDNDNSLDSQVTQISKRLGITFRGGDNFYRYEEGRQRAQLTISAKDGFVHVTLQGLALTPRIEIKASKHIGLDSLVDIVSQRLALLRAA
jgi:hypothetical protein